MIRGISNISSSTSRDDYDTSVSFTQYCTPSQFPNLFSGLDEIDKNINSENVLCEIKNLLSCPLCKYILINDPAVIDTCGHAFCYNCINTAIEYGVFRLDDNNNNINNSIIKEEENEKEYTEEVMKCNSDLLDNNNNNEILKNSRKRIPATRDIIINNNNNNNNKSKKRRKLQFTCPVCLGPAHKYNLVRVPLIREIVLEAMNYHSLSEVLIQQEEENNNNNNNSGVIKLECNIVKKKLDDNINNNTRETIKLTPRRNLLLVEEGKQQTENVSTPPLSHEIISSSISDSINNSNNNNNNNNDNNDNIERSEVNTGPSLLSILEGIDNKEELHEESYEVLPNTNTSIMDSSISNAIENNDINSNNSGITNNNHNNNNHNSNTSINNNMISTELRRRGIFQDLLYEL